MPLTAKGEKILAAMKKQYGEKKGESVFYASQKKGTIKGTHNPRTRLESKVCRGLKKAFPKDK